ncbi:sensor histidine kinase [Cryobacterium sp. HLT2-28]|uniref:sensor histidine kinase n=1 Tax=Cryobacterium sp. HLT2-28 TaxID=1259146 RepID=UPI00106B1A13|nr:sensor histidine kinase [Cryobacterium sp. HLT2-28]TFB93701.1 sensor histidine kinase [Cryobacterium sp. HLT2-28]
MPPHWDSDAPWYDHDRGRPGGGYGARIPAAARLWIPVVVSFLVQVPAVAVLARSGREFGPDAGREIGRVFGRELVHGGLRPGWYLAVVLALIGPLALIGARRYPGPVVTVAAAAAGALVLLRPDIGLPYVAVGFAIVLGIVRGARVWVYASVAAVWVATIGLAGLYGIPLQPGRIALTTLGLALLMGFGEAIRTRREQIHDLRRRADARRQSAEQRERVRIARELHDVLAHSLSQINVQAGVGLHLIDSQPGKAAEALASIKATSKNALDEVRTVLGILRSDVDPSGASGVSGVSGVSGASGADDDAPRTPQPDLAGLPALVESFSAQGLRVELVNELGPEGTSAPAATQLALYRICQEALTNVLRHSGARAASVHLAVDGADVRLTVTDDGTTRPGDASIMPGGGLLGMRERAELLGGSLRVERMPVGGFLVEARLPLRRPR